jgi:hypothetical protein
MGGGWGREADASRLPLRRAFAARARSRRAGAARAGCTPPSATPAPASERTPPSPALGCRAHRPAGYTGRPGTNSVAAFHAADGGLLHAVPAAQQRPAGGLRREPPRRSAEPLPTQAAAREEAAGSGFGVAVGTRRWPVRVAPPPTLAPPGQARQCCIHGSCPRLRQQLPAFFHPDSRTGTWSRAERTVELLFRRCKRHRVATQSPSQRA